jgi:hypothetical protein
MIKPKIVAVGAGLAVVAGAGGAYAAISDKDKDRQAFLNDVASRLNVSPDKLNSALKGAFFDRLDAAVKAGKLTKAQADEIKKRVNQNGGIPFGPGGGPKEHHVFAPGAGPGLFGAGFDAAASYLGITPAQLKAQFADGKSLADIAKAKGKSVDDLETKIQDAVKAKLDAAVKNKDITASQESKILSELKSRIDDIVNQSPLKLGHPDKRHLGPPPGGPPPWGP